MLKVTKIILMGYILFLSECYSMMPAFVHTITENATDKGTLFANLRAIPNGEEKELADEYIALYGDNELIGEARKYVLTSIVPSKKNKITGAAAYVVKVLFGQAKKEIYEIDTLDECIRVATLLLADVPQLASGRPMDNIGNMLQAARRMRQERLDADRLLYNLQHQRLIGNAFGAQ